MQTQEPATVLPRRGRIAIQTWLMWQMDDFRVMALNQLLKLADADSGVTGCQQLIYGYIADLVRRRLLHRSVEESRILLNSVDLNWSLLDLRARSWRAVAINRFLAEMQDLICISDIPDADQCALLNLVKSAENLGIPIYQMALPGTAQPDERIPLEQTGFVPTTGRT